MVLSIGRCQKRPFQIQIQNFLTIFFHLQKNQEFKIHTEKMRKLIAQETRGWN